MLRARFHSNSKEEQLAVRSWQLAQGVLVTAQFGVLRSKLEAVPKIELGFSLNLIEKLCRGSLFDLLLVTLNQFEFQPVKLSQDLSLIPQQYVTVP